MTRSKYPHLLSVDTAVWERFLNSDQNRFSHFDYDVRVGIGRDPGPDIEDKYRQLGVDLSQRRIDAIGHTPIERCIIEITTIATLKAIGQMSAYPILYRQTYPHQLQQTRLLVCEILETDIKSALTGLHIPFIQI